MASLIPIANRAFLMPVNWLGVQRSSAARSAHDKARSQRRVFNASYKAERSHLNRRSAPTAGKAVSPGSTWAGDMKLSGAIEGHPDEIELHRVKLSDFKLLSRGFHWVNEVPFNH